MASGGGSSSSVDMDPDVALRRFEEGATLVLLGVPKGTELGIDCKSWQVGPRFRGVKMIPPGLHFLHYSSVNAPSCGSEVGPKKGLFLSLKPREILLANWDPQEEDLDFSASKDEEQVSRTRATLQELDPHLGPYPYEVIRKWVSLTDRLSEELTQKLQPLSGRICAFSDVVPEVEFKHTKDRAEQPRNDTACQSMKEGLDRLPRMKPREGTELRFSQIPQKTYPPGATPAEITRCSLDLSYALETVLEKNYELQPLHLLGICLKHQHQVFKKSPHFDLMSSLTSPRVSQVSCSSPSCASFWETRTRASSTGSGCWLCCVAPRTPWGRGRSSTWDSSPCSTTSSGRSPPTSSWTLCHTATSSPPHCRYGVNTQNSRDPGGGFEKNSKLRCSNIENWLLSLCWNK